MSRLRLLLAWLVMAALPLQGFAAASMLFCGLGNQVAVVTAQTVIGHDHSQHAHVQAGKVSGETSSKLPDAGHKCGLCGACSHTLALTEFGCMSMSALLPAASLPEPAALLLAIPGALPDKPPQS